MAAEIRHQGVCPIHDVGCIDGVHFLTMAYIEGTSLHDLMHTGQPWPPAQAGELVRQIAEALHALHQRGIVHRDLKPGNIMIEPNGTPVLLDFGLARSLVAVSQKLTAEGAAMGTPAYMAPEQIGGKAETLGPHTDVYALGTILFELLTGRLPFQPGSMAELYGQILHAERPRPSSFADVCAALDQLCLDALAVDPTKRPPTMAHLVARLRQCQDNTPTLRRMPTPPPGPLPSAIPVPERHTPTQPVSHINTRSTAHRPSPEPALLTPLPDAPAGSTRKLALVAGVVLALLATGTAAWLLIADGGTPTSASTDDTRPTTPTAVLKVRLTGEVTVLAGQSEVVAVEVERQGWDGEVSLLPLDVPNDLQVTAMPIPRGETAGTVRIRALSDAAAGRHTMRLRALGDNGRTEQTLTVMVRRMKQPLAASLQLRLPPEVNVTAGGSETVIVEIERDNCPGEVKLLQDAGVEGITLRLSPIADGQSRTSVRVEADAAAKAGAYKVTILARGPGKVETEGSFTIRVKAAAAVQDKELTNCIGMKFVRIPAGKFTMGSPKEEADRSRDEEQHEVEITRPFEIGVYEVTQEEYERVMKTNPSKFRKGGEYEERVKGLDTKRFPVETVSHDDAVKFCDELNKLAKEKGENYLYRLPTEAEWEYSCRGGPPSYQVFHFGDKLSSKEANFDGNYPYGGAAKGEYLERPVAVDDPRYRLNAFGLYQMHGNVWEWCSDWYGDYPSGKVTDPTGPKEDSDRVFRGGSWFLSARSCRAANRFWFAPGLRLSHLGFRVARVPSGKDR